MQAPYLSDRLGRCLCGLFLIGWLLTAWLPSATAQPLKKLKLCNETSYFLNVSVALQVGAASQSKGWQTLMPGSCENSQVPFSGNESVFIYAQSDDIYAGPGQRFEGNEQFCVSFKGDFDIDGRRECRERGFTSADFANVDMQTDQPQISFSDSLDFGRKRAKTAAAQRLLEELGNEVGQIDGYSGRRTLTALDNFQKEHGLTRNSQISNKLLTKLYRAVKEIENKRGLLLCNKTDYLVWASVGQVQEDSFKTEGWLQIPPQKCQKGIREALNARYYFVYAEAVDDTGNPVRQGGRRLVWSGDFLLCTKPTRFVIKTRNDCDKKGLDKTKFMQIDTGAKTNWVVNFE
ncbi:MAG: DUF1036 domain-containing protein [Parvibaculales bacterium]